ncbi:hypothetical protein HPB50_026089 [Hyalomma asiaticum]|uniref:Uncharacterized protein n=1 Tax=Hyalomma asiaticum TaxID=266040 RepID=A0ACB7T9J5_HYAAI|nr:hypothetical protein HPB50_026089 [Hyalomma asiaticum]
MADPRELCGSSRAAAELSNSKDTYTVMVGINGQRSSSLYKKPYAIIRDNNKWSDPNQHFLDVYDGKKGDYICLQAQCRLPQFDRSNNVTTKNLFQFFFNGKHIPQNQSFASDADLKDVLSRMAYNGTYFNDVECTEHHMEYTGIVEGLPQDATKEYISWRGILLCYMSVGGSAVVTGKYKYVNPSVDGADSKIPSEIRASKVPDYKYAPLTSVDVERSFSAYKQILTERRHNFKPENLEMVLVCHCFHSLSHSGQSL